MTESTPLAGLRVVEVAGWNGVLAGRLIADAGADVVRIVPPGGDPLEAEPPFFGDTNISIQASWYNAGKRVVALDLGTAAGRGQLLDLVGRCDILIEDWPVGRPLFTAAELEGSNGRLARVSVTPMGSDGPWASFRTNDLVANGLCGAASVTGNADTAPLSGYGNQTYHTVGLYAAICALAAHRAAKATGQTQHVDLSAHEALYSCTEQLLMEWFFPNGAWQTAVARRQGSRHWSNAYEVYPSRDGHGIMITAALRFADIVLPWLKEEGAAQDLADPEKYPNVLALVRALPHVMQVLKEWVATKDGEELFYEGQRRRQPFGIVWNVGEAIGRSPQIAARKYLQPVDMPGFGSAGFPGRFFRTSADGPHPAPRRRVPYEEVGWTQLEPSLPDGGPATSTRPLAGIRILDFTHVLAGPFGTRVLGDLGADVIKVGTSARGGGANTPEHPYYICWNRNKRSVHINMGTEAGRAVARRLAAGCDVIIENFSAGVLARWGLDRAGLEDVNPGVSVISMGGMGQDGPWSRFVTFAPTIHAVTGLTYLTNPAGRHDLGYGFSLTDHLSGLAGALAAQEALAHRDRTGHGLSIDLSQYELGLCLLGPAILDYVANGVNPEPVGNRHPFRAWAPHGIYRCEGDDRWVAIAVRGDAEWDAFCGVMCDEPLASDRRFATHEARLAHEDALDAAVETWTRERDRYDVMHACQAAGIAAGAVQDGADLGERDEQLASRGFFATLRGETAGEYGYDRFPARFNGRRPEAADAVHHPGADTYEVVTSLAGLTDNEFANLVANGALS
jgi:crotonobetainyl-CoA:carnitine CoA-transferase CaiB-like acyl-CoA transferase